MDKHQRPPGPAAILDRTARCRLRSGVRVARDRRTQGRVLGCGPRRQCGSGRRAPPSGDRRPNIVFVLMDDFSLTCCRRCVARATWRGTGRRTTTPSWSTRCAACRAARPSPASTRTRPACCTNTAEPAQRPRADRRLAGVRENGKPRAAPSPCGSRSRLHDRLRRQVPQRLRGAARRPGAAQSRPAGRTSGRSSAAAYDGWGFRAPPTTTAGNEQVDGQRRPPPRPSDAGRGVRRHGDRRPARWTSSREHRDEDAPYFLEVAPYAPHGRVSATRRTTASRCSRRPSATGRAGADRAATAGWSTAAT